jgi:hypothetical protein
MNRNAQFLDQGFSLFQVVSKDSKVVHTGSHVTEDVSDAVFSKRTSGWEFLLVTLRSIRKSHFKVIAAGKN